MRTGSVGRRALAVGLAVAALASVSAACGGGGASTVALAEGVDREPATVDEARPASVALAAFGLDVYRELAAGEGLDTNLVLSPSSVGTALAMTRAGAAGTTADEFDSVLHFDDAPGGELDGSPYGAGQRAVNALDAAVTGAAGTVERPDGEEAEVVVATANSLWAQEGFGFEDPFLDSLARNYGAGVELVDYVGDTEGARLAINEWVSKRTEDRIEELIAPGILSELTRLVLTNAVYLRAPWAVPFDEGATAPGPFTRLDGTTSEVSFMAATEPVGYARVGDVEAVELPYAGDELSLLLLVPDAGSFPALAGSVDPALFDEVVGALTSTPVVLQLPRFSFTTEADLVPTLKALGLVEAFDQDLADFSAMSTEDRLFVSDVVHEAFVAVDESGTEAAAATAVVMNLTAAPESPVSLTVDRPFLFALRHRPSGALLFVGHVVDPAA